MKRLVSLILVLFILFVPAIAEANPTKRVNAFQYSDVYTKRLYEISAIFNTDARHDLSLQLYVGTELGEDMCSVVTSSGTLFITVSDMEIVRAMIDLCTFEDGESPMMTTVDQLRAASFFAALEHDPYEDDLYASVHEILGGGEPTVIQQAYKDFIEMYRAFYKDTKKMNMLLSEAGNEVLFMSGNYDYYLANIEFVYDGKTYHSLNFVAKAR